MTGGIRISASSGNWSNIVLRHLSAYGVYQDLDLLLLKGTSKLSPGLANYPPMIAQSNRSRTSE
jgi:hypothetical protein